MLMNTLFEGGGCQESFPYSKLKRLFESYFLTSQTGPILIYDSPPLTMASSVGRGLLS